MKLCAAFLAVVAAVDPPVISLDFEESSMKNYQYVTGKYGLGHPLRGFTPQKKEIPSSPSIQASYGVCTAKDPRNAKHCKLPNANAYDHHDGINVKVVRTSHLTNINRAGSGNCVGTFKQEKINWNRRSEYIIKYNAEDKSGNAAEEVYFSLMLDDPNAPVILSIQNKDVESSWTYNIQTLHSKIGERRFWTMPTPAAHDDIDGPTPVTISRSRVFDSNKLGRFSVVLQSSDKAACYGKNHKNNHARKVVWITVKDTLAPWIERTGALNVKTECGQKYKDAGAKCYDRHDSTSTDGAALVPIRHKVQSSATPSTTTKSPASFKITYDCKDSQGLAAVTQSRHVTVVDTTKPDLKITHIKEQKSSRGRYVKLTAKDLDKKSIFSEEKDSHVIHHSTGYKPDLKYIQRLTQNGYGYTCSDSCHGPTKPTVTTYYEKCTQYRCVKQGLAKCASLQCLGGWKNVDVYSGKEKGAYRLNYVCKDHVGNTAKKSRLIFNTDMQSIALVKSKFAFTCPTVDKFIGALVQTINSAFPHSGFTNKHIEIKTLNGKPYTGLAGGRRLVDAKKGANSPPTPPPNPRRQTVEAVLVIDDMTQLRHLVNYVRSPVFKRKLDKSCSCESTPGPPHVEIPPNPLKPWIVLHKGDTTFVEASTTAKYVDAGAICSDFQDGRICDTKNGKYGPVKQSRYCRSASQVQMNKPSHKAKPYQVSYGCRDISRLRAFQGVRYVHVRDTTKPTCKVIGAVDATHEAGFAYTDKFATGMDTLDGKITRKCEGQVTHGCIRTIGLENVNVKIPATYYVDYRAVDKAGNVGHKCRRIVNVVDTLKPVIALKYDSDRNYFHISDSSDTSTTHDGTAVTNPAGYYFTNGHLNNV